MATDQFRDMGFHITNLKQSDIAKAVILYWEDNWNISEETIRAQIEHFGPESFQAAYADDGRLLGTCAIYKLADKISYIDYVIVAKSHRRQGICSKLVPYSMQLYEDGMNFILDAVPGIEDVYRRKFGFKREHPMYSVDIPHSAILNFNGLHIDDSLFHVTTENISKVMAYDSTLHQFEYRKYQECMLLDKDNISICAIENDKVFGVLLFCGREFFLNTLHADDAPTARKLLAKLFSVMVSKNIIPKDGMHAVLLQKNHQNFTQCLMDLGVAVNAPSVSGYRMTRGDPLPEMAYDKIYAAAYFNVYSL